MKKGLFVIIAALVLMACGDGNVVIQVDPSIQLEEDSTIIAEYMEDKGYDNFKTTTSGVRYIILEEGSGLPIDESDIVTFDYVGMLTNDSIFDTSIQAIGDSIRNVEDIPDKFSTTFSENKIYSPFTITYAASGWTINGQFVRGFSDGVSATFKELNVGGRALVAMPSELGYGAGTRGLIIPANAVLVFEFFPTEVTKQ
ncbi:FKBP-type peptidyl-prolyl cis-trans isomerase [Ekhidna sp. To15]|uniref:FKBP-type peptidyl-prolyl cis-trans isomerase n=1 Tax=Ekhidna sp. To15 TaxID=3395267 RepID=UPI003F521388